MTAPQKLPTPPSTMMRKAGMTASMPTCGRRPQIGVSTTAGEAGEPSPEPEHQQAQPGQVDPERPHHLAVVGAGLDDGAVGGAFQEEPDRDDGDHREERRVELVLRVDETREQEGAGDGLRHLEVLLRRSPHQPDGLLDDQRGSEGQQETVLRLLPVGSAHAELQAHADDRDQQRRDENGQPVPYRQGKRPPCLARGAEPGEVGRDDDHREVRTRARTASRARG